MDNFKLVIAVLLLGGAIAGFYYYSDQILVLRIIGLLIVAGLSLTLASTTAVGRQVTAVVGDARTEVRKVVWPTRKEATQTTLMVVLMVLVVGILLWVLDMTLLWAVRFLTEQRG